MSIANIEKFAISAADILLIQYISAPLLASRVATYSPVAFR